MCLCDKTVCLLDMSIVCEVQNVGRFCLTVCSCEMQKVGWGCVSLPDQQICPQTAKVLTQPLHRAPWPSLQDIL